MKALARQKTRRRASPRPKRPYDTRLREEQAAMTRERVVAVVLERLLDVAPADLSYAEIARLAGVSVRTLYRHFPERAELLRAVARRFIDDVQDVAGPVTDLASFLRVLRVWSAFADDDPRRVDMHFKLPLYSTFGGPQVKRQLLADRLEGLDDEQQRVVAGFFDLMTSPYALKVLHQHWGLKAARAMPALELFIDAICDAARENPEALLEREDDAE